jgi:CHASE2 domain-containing sensor protein
MRSVTGSDCATLHAVRSPPARWWPATALLVIGVLAGASAIGLRQRHALDWLEHRTVQARFSIRGKQKPSPEVVVVTIDIASVQRVGRSPPPRRSSAKVVDALRVAGARVIAFDLELALPTDDAAADRALVRSLRRTGAAVVSVATVGPGAYTQPLVGRFRFDERVRAGLTAIPDDEGGVRRFPRSYFGVPTFAVVAAALQSPRTKLAEAPVRALIDYAGRAGTVPSLSYASVLEGRFDPETVRGKVVVVGPSYPAAGDLHPTAVGGPAMPGSEVQANAIATALDGYPLRTMSPGAQAALLVLLGSVVGLPLSVRARQGAVGATSVVITGTVALVAWTVAAQLAFGAGAVVDYSAGVCAVLTAAAGAAALVAVVRRPERAELRRLFADFKPNVVHRVLAQSALDPAGIAREEIVSGYALREIVGEGGMGVVYRATELALDREVALKLIRPQFALRIAARARFERETRAATLIGHPNIVPVYAAGEDDGLLFISMMLVDGIDLARTIGVFGPLDHDLLVTLLTQIASALDAAHAAGLIHRDVKPANILVASDPPHAYLTDFGIAKQLRDDDLTITEGWVGTVDYLAPEIAAGGQASRQSDIYALAGVLFYCVTGSVPFDLPNETAKLRAHADAPRPCASAATPGMPVALDAVIARGMAKQPAKRFATATQLANAAARALRLGGREIRPRRPPSDRGDDLGEPTA